MQEKEKQLAEERATRDALEQHAAAASAAHAAELAAAAQRLAVAEARVGPPYSHKCWPTPFWVQVKPGGGVINSVFLRCICEGSTEPELAIVARLSATAATLAMH